MSEHLHLYTLNVIFKTFCGLVTIFMVGYWLEKFLRNEDLSMIQYKRIETSRNIIYPEVTICNSLPFIDGNFKDVGIDISLDDYRSYLRGEKRITEDYGYVDFDNVTLDLRSFIRHVYVSWRKNVSMDRVERTSREHFELFEYSNNFNGFWGGFLFTRCFGLKVNTKFSHKIRALRITFEPELVPLIETAGKLGYIYAAINYPQQILISPEEYRTIWTTAADWFNMTVIRISNFEVLKRRNKKERPCFKKWRRFDDLVMMKHLLAAGCRAPYHNSTDPLCNQTNKMREAKVEFYEIKNKYHPLPCQEMSNIAFTVDVMVDQRKNGTFSPQMYIMYPDKVKIISQVKSIDAHSLIGNIGGYIGLFLGRFFIQISNVHFLFLFFYMLVYNVNHME